MDLDSIVGQLAAPAIGKLLIGRPPGEPVSRETVRAVVWPLTRAIEPQWRRMHVRQTLFIAVMSYLRWARSGEYTVVGYEVDLGEGRRADLVLESSDDGHPPSVRINELKLAVRRVLDPRVEDQIKAHLRLGHPMFGASLTGVRLICLGDHRWSRHYE
jgi:hypothetical protein